MVKAALVAMAGVVLLAACASPSGTQARRMRDTPAMGALADEAEFGAGIGAGVGLTGSILYDRHTRIRDLSYAEGYAAGRAGR